jgi:NADH dehydrogenase FAD-containing subunit
LSEPFRRRRVVIVGAGILDPRRIAVPLAGLEPGVQLIQGMVDEVDVTSGRVVIADPVNADLLAFLRS